MRTVNHLEFQIKLRFHIWKQRNTKSWKGQRKKELPETVSVTNIRTSSEPTVWWVWTLAVSKSDSGFIHGTINLCGLDIYVACTGKLWNTFRLAQRSIAPSHLNPNHQPRHVPDRSCILLLLSKADFPTFIYKKNTFSVNLFKVPKMPASHCHAQWPDFTHSADHLGTGQGTPTLAQVPFPSLPLLASLPHISCHSHAGFCYPELSTATLHLDSSSLSSVLPNNPFFHSP